MTESFTCATCNTTHEGLPTDYALHANAHAMARYAALCQEADIVPIVEPEVLMDGTHTVERAVEVTTHALSALYRELFDQQVFLAGTLLKPNMCLSGYGADVPASDEDVADATIGVFEHCVPAAVPADQVADRRLASSEGRLRATVEARPPRHRVPNRGTHRPAGRRVRG